MHGLNCHVSFAFWCTENQDCHVNVAPRFTENQTSVWIALFDVQRTKRVRRRYLDRLLQFFLPDMTRLWWQILGIAGLFSAEMAKQWTFQLSIGSFVVQISRHVSFDAIIMHRISNGQDSTWDSVWDSVFAVAALPIPFSRPKQQYIRFWMKVLEEVSLIDLDAEYESISKLRWLYPMLFQAYVLQTSFEALYQFHCHGSYIYPTRQILSNRPHLPGKVQLESMMKHLVYFRCLILQHLFGLCIP